MIDHLKRAEMFRASLPPKEPADKPAEPAVLFPLMAKLPKPDIGGEK